MSVPLWLCYYFTCDNVLNIVPFVAHISTSGLLTANTSPLCVYTMCILYSQHYPIVCVPCVHPTANTIPLSVYSMCALYSQHYPTVYIYHVYTVSRLSSLLLGHFSGFNFLAIVRGSEFLISIPLAINLQVELWSHMIIQFNVLRNSQTLSQWLYQFAFPPATFKSVYVYISIPQEPTW